MTQPVAAAAPGAPHQQERTDGAFGGATAAEEPTTTRNADGATSHDVTHQGSPTSPTQEVRLGDSVIGVLTTPLGAHTAAERAKLARDALERALSGQDHSVVVRVKSGTRVLYVGESPILELTEADRVAQGRADLESLADEFRTKIRKALAEEKRRQAVAHQVLSVSSAVFLGLMALLFLRAVGTWARRLQQWVDSEGRRLGALTVHSVELLPANVVREGMRVGIQAALLLVRLAVFLSWLLVTLSLFDSTRELAERTTGRLFAPGALFIERLAARVPTFFALLFALLVVLATVRFVLAYFRAIERGEVESEWASPYTAHVTGRLIGLSIALGALLFVVPLLTGTDDGLLTRMGVLALAALALATTPLGASCALGLRIVYGGALRTGDLVSYGGQTGRVEAVGLFDLSLRSDEDELIRVPHLMSLWHATRVREATSRTSRPPALRTPRS